MTISTDASRNDYTGNGSTTAFAFTFTATASTDVTLYIADVLQTSGYTVSGTFPGTGTVTITPAPASGASVAVVRATPFTQGTDLVENDDLPAATTENALDKLTILAQQAKAIAMRSWRFVAGSPFAADGYELPTPKALTYPRVTSDCSTIEFVALTATGTYADPVTTQGDMIVGGTTGVQERLPIGSTNGMVLYRDPDTSRPGWKPGLAISLTNKADAAVGAGCVLLLALNCDRAAVVNNVAGCTGIVVVAPASIGDDCEALWTVAGIARNVTAQGPITRGDYLRKSAVSQALESTSVQAGAQSAPIGSVGIALTAGASNAVDAYLFGHTVSSRVQGTCGKFAKFGTSCSAADSVVTENPNDLTSTLPLILPTAVGITPVQHGLYREGVKALVIFDGTNGTAVGDSPSPGNGIVPAYHVNTTGIVTKLADGDWCVSFLTAFSCARAYVIQGSAAQVGGALVGICPVTMNTGCVRFRTLNNGNVLVNPTIVTVAFVGGQ